MMRIAVVLFAVMTASCTSFRPHEAMWHRGVTDPASGRLVAFWVMKPTADEPVTINEDYGMLIVWDEFVRRFFLFSNPTKTYFVSDDFDQFLSELDQLPKDITLDWADTCTVPRFWKMPESERKRLSAVLQKGNRQNTRESEHPHIACYCESDGIKLLGAEPSAWLYGARPHRQ